MTVSEHLEVLDQARELGLGGIGIIGPYEPLSEPGILDLIDGIRCRGLRATVFTKGLPLTAKMAAALNLGEVAVGISVHSLDARVHDNLSGREGSFVSAMRAVTLLLENGYAAKRSKIIIQSVVTHINVADLPELWQWARGSGFVPFFERMTVQGAARQNLGRLRVPPKQFQAVCESIAQIDRKRFGLTWTPHPPWIGEACTRHLNSCHVTFDGYVQPCTGVDIPIGNVRDEALREMLLASKVMWDLRSIRNTISGACGRCSMRGECYGCRGQAYQLTGDYLAADPCCWFNPERCGSAGGMRAECQPVDELAAGATTTPLDEVEDAARR